jgi:hypothetical protein
MPTKVPSPKKAKSPKMLKTRYLKIEDSSTLPVKTTPIRPNIAIKTKEIKPVNLSIKVAEKASDTLFSFFPNV